jgi:hypothetical protein
MRLKMFVYENRMLRSSPVLRLFHSERLITLTRLDNFFPIVVPKTTFNYFQRESFTCRRPDEIPVHQRCTDVRISCGKINIIRFLDAFAQFFFSPPHHRST